MALETKERYWDAQRESLSRIRDQIGSGKKTKRPHQQVPQRGPALRRVPTGSPHATYKRTPPPRLDRIDTLEREYVPKNTSDLRASRYGKVPPLKPRRGFESTEDEDSWGEDAESEEDSEYEGARQPYHLPPPDYPYPVVYPTVIYTAAPPHTSYDGRHSKHRHSKNKSLDRSRKKVRYAEEPTYFEYKNASRTGKNDYRYSDESPDHLEYIYPRLSPFDPALNPILKRYQYPGPPVEDGALPWNKKAKLVREASELVRDRPSFATKFTNQLIDEFLDEEILPDLLIQVLSEQSEHGPRIHANSGPTADIANEIFDNEVVLQLRGIVVEVLDELTDSYLGKRLNQHDPVSDFTNQVVDDVVQQETSEVVQEVVQELVVDHLVKAASYDIVVDLITEEIGITGPVVVDEALMDVLLETFIEEEVLQPEVNETCHEVAVELLTHYDNKVRKQQLRELNKFGGQMLVDMFCLDYCLSLIGRQNHILTEDLGAERLLDGHIIEILLAQMFAVKRSREATIDNKPVKRLHEKMVTDVALDVMLEELCLSLDEDMADLDEYEQGYSVDDGAGCQLYVHAYSYVETHGTLLSNNGRVVLILMLPAGCLTDSRTN